MQKPIYILGTALSHDGSTCLMKDGKIIFAVEKERISRIKHDGFNDNMTIQYCLDAAGIEYSDLTLIVEQNSHNPLFSEKLEYRKNRVLPSMVPVVTLSHHLAHAYSAIGTSPFDDMGIVVIDGHGGSLDNCNDLSEGVYGTNNIHINNRYRYWETCSYYVYQNGKITPIFKDFSRWVNRKDRKEYPAATWEIENSIGEFYEGIALYIFGELDCAGKLMGLAPYGRPDIIDWQPFFFNSGKVILRNDWWINIDPQLNSHPTHFHDNFQYYADLAWWAQTKLEEALFYLFNYYYQLYPMANFAYAGGVALNATANEKLINDCEFEHLYIQPAAGDNGLSIGCCYYGWLEVLKKGRTRHCGSTFFGKNYNDISVLTELEKYKERIEYTYDDEIETRAAESIAAGHVIAWFQGESEFGPRALGNRSILADPRNPQMKDHINANVKFREDFRPFAPAVLHEKVHDYFNLTHDSDYMLFIAYVKEQYRADLPSIVHIDGSARVQTVKQHLNKKFHKLITAFFDKTGIPILLNTSLNTKGMPIVETPADAIHLFLNCGLDYLFINNYKISKK
ncbi:putative transferase [Yersinia frederiksenii]|uniref:Carbamoyltransferase family protein n=2 Tax=Yersinia frederiksenii TaxID=29484 RepID=A0ABR4VZA6_YERFR|nr:carbamoyltransferase C-terminal domain-containing protein [Yersinia frederiksenii]ATM97307.1 transferase [Yersinia frederiksenii]EEQ13527.1 transferase [Yersinia frederiksenii ATCC 33641]KGA45280.1 carbamoyltransferase family protein [Yersinia frederiksenii ATCC 33641]SUP78296.1 putative transferase [Yersinia frederiksenii]